MLFGKSFVSKAKSIKKLLHTFSLACTAINEEKYQIYFFNTWIIIQRNILKILHFQARSLPSKYLGAPLVYNVHLLCLGIPSASTWKKTFKLALNIGSSQVYSQSHSKYAEEFPMGMSSQSFKVGSSEVGNSMLTKKKRWIGPQGPENFKRHCWSKNFTELDYQSIYSMGSTLET